MTPLDPGYIVKSMGGLMVVRINRINSSWGDKEEQQGLDNVVREGLKLSDPRLCITTEEVTFQRTRPLVVPTTKGLYRLVLGDLYP